MTSNSINALQSTPSAAQVIANELADREERYVHNIIFLNVQIVSWQKCFPSIIEHTIQFQACPNQDNSSWS